MKRNRIFLALGVLLAAALGLWLGPKLHRGPMAGSLPELLNYAPADADVIIYTDLAGLRASPMLAKLVSSSAPVATDKDYQDFVSATGFDFSRDLDRALVTVRPKPFDQTVVLAEGRFDRQKIEQYAARGGKSQSRNGRTEYVLPSTTPNKKITLTFLEGNRLALSDGGDVLAALPAAPDDPAKFDAPMRERLSRVAGSPFFVVTRPPAMPANAPSSNKSGVAAAGMDFLAPLANMHWITVAMQPEDQQVIVSFEGECDNPAAADKAKSTIEFMRVLVSGVLLNPKALGKTSAESAAAVSDLLQAAQVSSEGSRVRLLLPITPAMLNGLAALAPNAADQTPALPAGKGR